MFIAISFLLLSNMTSIFRGEMSFGHYANPEARVQQQSAFSVVVRDLVCRDTLPAGIEQQLPPVVVGFWPRDPFIEDRWKQVFVVIAFFEQQVVLAGEIKLVGLLELKSGIVFKVIHHSVALHIFLRHDSVPHLALLYRCSPVYWNCGERSRFFPYSARMKQTIVPECSFLIIILRMFREIVPEDFFPGAAPNGRVSGIHGRRLDGA